MINKSGFIKFYYGIQSFSIFEQLNYNRKCRKNIAWCKILEHLTQKISIMTWRIDIYRQRQRDKNMMPLNLRDIKTYLLFASLLEVRNLGRSQIPINKFHHLHSTGFSWGRFLYKENMTILFIRLSVHKAISIKVQKIKKIDFEIFNINPH